MAACVRAIPGAGEEVEAVAAVATDVTDLHQALASLRSRSAEQAIMAELGQRALEARKPVALWERAVTALAEHLDADLAEVHEVDSAGRRLGPLASVDRRAGRQARHRAAQRPRATRLTVPVGRPDQPFAVLEIERSAGPFSWTRAARARPSPDPHR